MELVTQAASGNNTLGVDWRINFGCMSALEKRSSSIISSMGASLLPQLVMSTTCFTHTTRVAKPPKPYVSEAGRFRFLWQTCSCALHRRWQLFLFESTNPTVLPRRDRVSSLRFPTPLLPLTWLVAGVIGFGIMGRSLADVCWILPRVRLPFLLALRHLRFVTAFIFEDSNFGVDLGYVATHGLFTSLELEGYGIIEYHLYAASSTRTVMPRWWSGRVYLQESFTGLPHFTGGGSVFCSVASVRLLLSYRFLGGRMDVRSWQQVPSKNFTRWCSLSRLVTSRILSDWSSLCDYTACSLSSLPDRSLLEKLQWLQLQSRPDLSYGVNRAEQRSSAPTIADARALNAVALKAQRSSETTLRYPRGVIDVSTTRLVTHGMPLFANVDGFEESVRCHRIPDA